MDQKSRTETLDKFRSGEITAARSERRRRPRSRYPRRLPHLQLRPALAARRLRSPYRPHGPRRQGRQIAFDRHARRSEIAEGHREDARRGRRLDRRGPERARLRQRRSLAADKLIALIGLWYAETGKYDVLPVDWQRRCPGGSRRSRRGREATRPLRLSAGTQSIPFFAAPRVLNRPHSITAKVELPEGGAEGVLLVPGHRGGGYSLFVQDQRLHYVHNYVETQPAQGLHLGPAAERRARAPLRVRAHRPARHGQRPGCARTAAALRRRRAGRRGRRAGDHAVHARTPGRSPAERTPGHP